MNKKMTELKRRGLEKHIKLTYYPIPKYIDVWVEDDVFKSLVKFEKDDDFTTLAVWDMNDYECLAEITLTDKTYKKIYKTTAAHRLYSAASKGE